MHMSKKEKIILLVIGIFLTLSIMISISYAYYIFSVSQSGTNVVRSDCFEITYSDSNPISLSNTIPLTDMEARDLTPYTFTIKNICNNTMEYNVNIETLNTSTMDLDAVATKLDGKKKQVLGTLTNNENKVNNNAASSKTIYTGILKAGEEIEHNLRLWIDVDATIAQSMNKSYSSKVVITSSLKPDYSELISGVEFNVALKKLAGNNLTQEQIDKFNEVYEEVNSYCSAASSEEYEFQNCDYFLDFYSNSNNIYIGTTDTTIENIEFVHTLPSNINNLETGKLSTDDSKNEILAWFIDDTAYIYSEDDVIYATDMVGMFSGLSSLQSLDLSDLDTSKITDMSYLFSNLTSLTSLDISNFDTSNVTNMAYMFNKMSSVTNLDLSNFDTSNVENMAWIFSKMDNLTSLDLSNFDTSKVRSMAWMFAESSNLTNLDLSNFDTSNVTDMSWMFSYLGNLTYLNISSFDTSKVTDMNHMFYTVSSLANLDVSHFNTSNVTNMAWMFLGLNSLTSLDVSNFDTSNVTLMNGMFESMSGLTSLDLSNFDTSKVTDMMCMFWKMSNLKSLDISSFDTSKVENMSNMFAADGNLETIYVSNLWNTSSVINHGGMFKDDTKIVGGSGTTYNASHIDKEYARADGGVSNPGYFTLKTT